MRDDNNHLSEPSLFESSLQWVWWKRCRRNYDASEARDPDGEGEGGRDKVHGIMAIYDVGVHVNYDCTRALIISGLPFYRSGIQFNRRRWIRSA